MRKRKRVRKRERERERILDQGGIELTATNTLAYYYSTAVKSFIAGASVVRHYDNQISGKV